MENRGLNSGIRTFGLVVVLCLAGCNGGRVEQEPEGPVEQAVPAGSAVEEEQEPTLPEAVPVELAEPPVEETPRPKAPPAAPRPIEQKVAPAPETPPEEARLPEPPTPPTSSEEAEPPASPPETMPPAPEPPPPSPPPVPEIVEVTVAAGTVLELELLTALDSSVSRVNDEIQARTVAPIYVEGEPVLPSGTYVEGRVTEVEASGRVRGRARLGFTFDRLSTRTGLKIIRTSFVDEEASSETGKDAKVIGGAAGIGALIGGILGGKKGAAIGATVGGAGGAGVVLSTKGEEIRLPVGTQVNVRLDEAFQLQIN